MFNCKNCSRRQLDFDIPITISEEKVYHEILEERNYQPPTMEELVGQLNVRPDVFGSDIMEQLLPLYQQINFPTSGTQQYTDMQKDKRIGPYILEFERQLSKCQELNNLQDNNNYIKQTDNLLPMQNNEEQAIEINEDMTYKPKNRTLTSGNRTLSIEQDDILSIKSKVSTQQQVDQLKEETKMKKKENHYNKELKDTTKALLQEYHQQYGQDQPVDQEKFHQFIQQQLNAKVNAINQQITQQKEQQQQNNNDNNQENLISQQNNIIIQDEEDPEPFEIPVVHMTSRNSIRKRVLKSSIQQHIQEQDTKLSGPLNQSQTQIIQKQENSHIQTQNLSLSDIQNSHQSTKDDIMQDTNTQHYSIRNSAIQKEFRQIEELINKNNELMNDFPNLAFSTETDNQKENNELDMSQLSTHSLGSYKFTFKTEGQNLKIYYFDYTYTVPLIPINFVYDEKQMLLNIYARKHGRLQKIIINDPIQYYWNIIKREILRAFGDGGYQNT